jgi:hypothetical protein
VGASLTYDGAAERMEAVSKSCAVKAPRGTYGGGSIISMLITQIRDKSLHWLGFEGSEMARTNY